MAEVTEDGYHFDIKKLSFIGVLVSLGIVLEILVPLRFT